MVPPAPRPVLDHEGLSELLADLLEHHARDDVAGDAGRDRHDHGDIARRPFLRRGRRDNSLRAAGPGRARRDEFSWLFIVCILPVAPCIAIKIGERLRQLAARR